MLVLVLAFLFWDNYAVALRSVTMQIRAQDFVVAAEAIGASRRRIILSEILPNLTNQVIVILTLEIALAITDRSDTLIPGTWDSAANTLLGVCLSRRAANKCSSNRT